VRGELQVNGHRITAGDALLFESESQITITQGTDAEVLLFDLAA